MKNKLKGNIGIIFITLLAYLFLNYLLIFDFIEKNSVFNDTLQDAMIISDIRINNIHIFITIIIVITAIIIWLFNYIIYKVICNLCVANTIPSKKLLLASLISLFPGLLITYFICSYNYAFINNAFVVLINTFCNNFTICFLLSEDMDRKQLVKVSLFAIGYGVINVIACLLINKPF